MANKSGRFRCSKCDRRFAMAAHLGRHMSTMHGGKRKPQGKRGRPGRPAGRPSGGRLDGQGLLSAIQAARAQLIAQLEALDQALATLGGAARPTATARLRGRRPAHHAFRGGREGSLRSYIEQVLKASGKPMRVTEITAAVRKAGYPTKNKTLEKSVGITLAGMRTAKRVERGVFVAK